MFWLFGCCVNCQCVNHCLWNSSKLPFTGAVLQLTFHPTHPHTRPQWAGSRSVGQWSQISHIIQVRRCRFIHLGDVHSKQWAALIASSVSIPRSVVLRVIELLCTLFFIRIWQPVCGILFVNNHKNLNRLWTAVFIFKNVQKPTAYPKMETTSL